jgi:hypothetical protein
MARMRIAFSTGVAALLASCAAVPPGQSPTDGPCPIIGSSDWAAWVNAMPGPNARPQLIATGKVTVPTGGYTFAWRDLRVAESYPVQVFAELEALPPDGPATQAIETHDLRGEWPIDPPVGSLTITCDGRTLARISPVETAH